jgi:hypothetical protein
MREEIRELEDLNLVYKNSKVEWVSPSLMLSKPEADQYRITVDLCAPNASKTPTAWHMPDLQNEFNDLHGSEVSRR